MTRSPSHNARLRKRIGFGLVVALVIGGLYGYLPLSPRDALPIGNVPVPQGPRHIEKNDSAYAQATLRFWSDQSLGDWQKCGKVEEPRIMLARFRARHLLPETNEYLLGLRPWGKSGSTWQLHQKGDYDFTLTVLTSILWLYGEDETRLSPATREHLLNVLLTEDGGDYRETVPRSLGLVRDTENHLFGVIEDETNFPDPGRNEAHL